MKYPLICSRGKKTLKLVSREMISMDTKSGVFHFSDFYMRTFPPKLMWTETLLWLKSYTCWLKPLYGTEKAQETRSRMTCACSRTSGRGILAPGTGWDVQVVPCCSLAIDRHEWIIPTRSPPLWSRGWPQQKVVTINRTKPTFRHQRRR